MDKRKAWEKVLLMGKPVTKFMKVCISTLRLQTILPKSQEVLLTLYKAQIRPSLEYCSHIWGAAAPTTLSILDAVQKRAIRLIGDPALTCHLQPLSHRRALDNRIDIIVFQNTYAGKTAKYTDLAIEIKRLWKQNKVIIVFINMKPCVLDDLRELITNVVAVLSFSLI
nr:unnamed protein product [Callosobruchus chinensis]